MPAVTDGAIVAGVAIGGALGTAVGVVDLGGTAVEVTGAVVGTARATVVGVALRGLLVRTTGAAMGR